tara:strand:- start:114 stop:281 length:168 start_codon:yes stop_codon:yes gene_type:complete
MVFESIVININGELAIAIPNPAELNTKDPKSNAKKVIKMSTVSSVTRIPISCEHI